MATLIRVDKNGTKYFEGLAECPRCSGAGIYYIGVLNGKLLPSWVDQGVCFQCGGSGKVQSKWKEYTPEYEAKLNARREARFAEQQKRIAEEEAKRRAEREAKEEAERQAKAAKEAEEAARKANSKHVGNIGDKLELEASLEKKAHFDVPSYAGFGTDRMFVYTFRDGNGNALVWKTAKGINFEAGDKVTIRGTVKDHSEYKDEKQTVLTRCKIAGA